MPYCGNRRASFPSAVNLPGELYLIIFFVWAEMTFEGNDHIYHMPIQISLRIPLCNLAGWSGVSVLVAGYFHSIHIGQC